MQTNDHKTRDYSAVLEAQYGAQGTSERAKFDEEAYAYTSQILIEKIRDIIVSEISPDKIILFGSRARGDCYADSDYDILVLKRGVTNERKISGDLKIRFYKEKLFASVDVMVMEHDKFYQFADTPGLVYKNIKKEGIYIYGNM